MSGSRSRSQSPSKTSAASEIPACDEWCRPDFVYGGPFIQIVKPEPFLTIATPINIEQQGTFKKSYAYRALKDRLPVILTKVIDAASKKGNQEYVKMVAKLKSDLVTNKDYEQFTVDTAEAKKWNIWIDNCQNKKYFNNTWLFTECYVYRKLREGCELNKALGTWDPFEEQKNQAFTSSLEPMCIVAEKVVTMLTESPKDKRKQDFMLLLKICLWANKCDLSLTLGENVTVAGPPGGPDAPLIDPLQMVIDYKDKVLVDDSGKACDTICTKADNMKKSIAAVAPPAGTPGGASPPVAPPPADAAEPPPKIPCPAKMVVPSAVLFDIVCDNAGYELFADLCFANFLIAQKIVQKVRFHVKNIPWFVSDVTPKDFSHVISSCANASFSRTVQPLEAKPVKEGTEPPPPLPPRVVSADALKQLGAQWAQFVQEGVFVVCDEPYWTYPHPYRDMKKYEYNMYRKLQYASGILFKGDLNYRKLLGDRNTNPVSGFEPALQGFIPAPMIAVRTVKTEIVCGLPKGKFEAISKIDQQWMEKGDYGVIQFCAKAEALKVSDRPCIDYGVTCFGGPCPVHADM